MNISVVVPAYNEKGNIKNTVEELLSVFKSISEIDKFEIIVVDDHSSDNTFEVIKNINDPKIKCLRLSRRCGSHIALRAGVKESIGDVILCVSADGQDDPSCLKKMLDKWRSGNKIIWAFRRNRENEPWYIKKPARLFYKLLDYINRDAANSIDLSRADFCLLDRVVVNALNKCPEKNTSFFGLISWLGFKQDFVEYQRRIRRCGSSKWNLISRIRLALDWLIAFSGLPLKLISITGITVASFGFLYSIYIIINAIKGIPIPGWASIMVVILVIGGIQMIMLGVIGEYLWRNIEESRKRPLYFIEKDTSLEER